MVAEKADQRRSIVSITGEDSDEQQDNANLLPKPDVEVEPERVETRYQASIYTAPHDCLPDEFVTLIHALEQMLEMRIWLLIQGHGQQSLDARLVNAFRQEKAKLSSNEPVGLLIDSPGGYARAAFQIANLFKRRCDGFAVIVPRYAKSAATLLALGADKIILGEDGELGPLDAQIYDPDYEGFRSGLDEVQSLERLHASALEAVDQSVISWVGRSGKKIDVLLPIATKFVSDMMRPLYEKIDTVHYIQRSRMLKEAEEYAIRLLMPQHSPAKATEIARGLVEDYPEHGFIIDIDEATQIGLRVQQPTDDIQNVLDEMQPYLQTLSAIGRIEEVMDE